PRTGPAGIVRCVDRLKRIGTSEFGADGGEPGGPSSSPVRHAAGRRALEQTADQDTEGYAASHGGDRMLLGESGELVLGFDGRFAGAVDDGRAAAILVAGLAGLHLLLE